MNRITITAGIGEDRHGATVAPDALAATLATIRARFASTFGGYTETDATGGWIAPDGRLVVEPAKRWTLLTDADAADAYALGEAAARMVGRGLNQASVVLEVEPVKVTFVEVREVAAEVRA